MPKVSDKANKTNLKHGSGKPKETSDDKNSKVNGKDNEQLIKEEETELPKQSNKKDQASSNTNEKMGNDTKNASTSKSNGTDKSTAGKSKDTGELSAKLEEASKIHEKSLTDKEVDKNAKEKANIIASNEAESSSVKQQAPKENEVTEEKIDAAVNATLADQVIMTSSVMNETLQAIIKSTTTFKAVTEGGMSSFELTFKSEPKVISTITAQKIVTGPPRLLSIVKERSKSNSLMYEQYYDPLQKGDVAPFIKNTLETFAIGTEVLRVVLKTENTTNSIEHDPNQPLKGSSSFMNPIEIISSGAVERPESGTSIFNLLDAVIFLALEIVPSCRVIIQGMIFETIFTNVPYNGLMRFLVGKKIPRDVGVHPVFNINHPLTWFGKDVVDMVMTCPNNFHIGELHTTEWAMGHGKRRRIAALPSDQAAADLYAINCMRRRSLRMRIEEYLNYLRSFCMEGCTVRIKQPTLTDDDYDFIGLNKYMFYAYYFMYLVSNQFKNGMTRTLKDYALSFNIVSMREIAEVIGSLSGKQLPATISRHLTQLQSKYGSVSPETFVNIMMMNLLSAFYDVEISIRAAKAETDVSFLDLLSNLILLFVFPAITRQNLHILGFNIVSLLLSLNDPQMLRFNQNYGFAEGHPMPVRLSDDEYFSKGKIPRIFDRQIPAGNNKLISDIRSLLIVYGRMVNVVECTGVEHPTFDGQKKVFMPWEKTCRQEGYANNMFKQKVRIAINICKNVISRWTNTMSTQRASVSGTMTLMATLSDYVDEFSQAYHHEFYDLYYMMARHMGFLHSDFTSNEDIYKPNPNRFGLLSTKQEHTMPWAPQKEKFPLNWTIGLSMVLTTCGLLKPITDRSMTSIKIQYPNPITQYTMLDTILKSCAETVEPYTILRNLLDNDYGDVVTNLIKTTIVKSGLRESYLNLMRKLFTGKNVPEDMFIFFEQELVRSNKLIMTKPKVVLVNRNHEDVTSCVSNKPYICNLVLDMEDPFISMELEVAMKLVLSSSSLLLKFGCGVVIQKTNTPFNSPRNKPNKWVYEVKKVVKGQSRLLTERYVEGKKKVAFEHNGKFYHDFESCDFPKILWEAEHPEMISHQYIDIIYRLIMRGFWAFKFTRFFFQASILYLQEVPTDFAINMTKRIFNTRQDDVCELIFIDTTGAVYGIFDEAVSTEDAQYIFTDVALDNDVLLRNLYGHQKPPRGHKPLNPLNWMKGSTMTESLQYFSTGTRKLDTGIPNFLNVFSIDNNNAYLRTYPSVEYEVPPYYFTGDT